MTDEAARERAVQMARRLFTELAGAGVPDRSARERILDAYRLAMEPRLERLAGDDPALLHPARSVLVLLLDVGPRSPEVLSATALIESEDDTFRTKPGGIAEALGDEVAALVEAVPMSGDARLAKALLSAKEDVRLAALAERLDQLRHAHLWDDPGRLREAHREAREVYLPLAERTHEELARRFRWWCDKFDTDA